MFNIKRWAMIFVVLISVKIQVSLSKLEYFKKSKYLDYFTKVMISAVFFC